MISFIDWSIRCFLLITVLAVFVPWIPSMPGAGLDPSWRFGLNQAVAQGISFGSELIFTLGPYASIYTGEYHPATNWLMLFGSIYLAINYWVVLICFMKERYWFWSVAYGVALAGIIPCYRDQLMFSYPLLLALLVYCFVSDQNKRNSWMRWIVPFLFLPLGLLPIIKGSLILLCCFVPLWCSWFCFFNRERFLAILCPLMGVMALLLFWIIAGASIIDLPHYFISIGNIISGYTEAMSSGYSEQIGKNQEILIYLGFCIILSGAIFFQKKISLGSKFFLLGVFGIFLFTAFKYGFVRHDGHALCASIALVITGLLVPCIIKSRFAYFVSILGVIGCLIIGSYNYLNISTIHRRIPDLYLHAWQEIIHRISDPTYYEKEFNRSLLALKDKAHFPLLPGTTDIYSYDQSYLIASGNRWNPRPIFQSYSAYTPLLAEKNREHLLADKAPDNIFFNIQPIDDRIPSMEDGASWPALLTRYEPHQFINGFLLLEKRKNGVATEPVFLKYETCFLGETVKVSNQNELLSAQIKIQPTFLGRLLEFLFKPTQLKMVVTFENGTKKEYRLISKMILSGFLISPWIEEVKDFALLYGNINLLKEKRPVFFSIISEGFINFFWKKEYRVTFKELAILHDVNKANNQLIKK